MLMFLNVIIESKYLTFSFSRLFRIPMEQFNYLGVFVNIVLFLVTHSNSICSKARRLFGVIYWKKYNHCNMTMSTISLVLDLTWNMLAQCVVNELLEKVQLFACNICLHWWDKCNSNRTLSILDILSLSSCCSNMKLSLFIITTSVCVIVFYFT